MTNATIGHVPCPICEKTADVRESKKDKAYIQCDDCGCQCFARGFQANILLRAKMKKVESISLENPVKTVDVKPKVSPEAKPAEEKTIFDILGNLGGDK